ncbi:MAG: hypothetical protein K2Y39_15980 [Candidatus Obscuribacterales bacterium]|nr:hypothetical protein [Candidatus Obscuribacterales bacterium]
MSFNEFLYGIALVVSALVSLLMLTFARSGLGFLALLVGSAANYVLMLYLAWYVAPYCAFAYAIVSLIAGAVLETVICDKEDAERSRAKIAREREEAAKSDAREQANETDEGAR